MQITWNLRRVVKYDYHIDYRLLLETIHLIKPTERINFNKILGDVAKYPDKNTLSRCHRY